MIPFRYRFHGHGGLRYVYKNGRSARSRVATVRVSTHPKRKLPRLAVVVSKRVHKGAVGRNRIRRRVYEVLSTELPRIKPAQDVAVIIASSDVRTMPYDELKRTICSMLHDLDVYRLDN